MWVAPEVDGVLGSNWSGRQFIKPAANRGDEMLVVSASPNKTTAGAAGGGLFWEHNSGGGFTASGAITPERSTTRWPTYDGTASNDISGTTPASGTLFILIGGSPGRDENMRWRAPRPWARPKIDAVNSESGNFAYDRWQAQVTGGSITHTGWTGFAPAWTPCTIQRLIRRPRRAGLWGYYQAQNNRLAQDAMVNPQAPEQWVAMTPSSINIRQQNGMTQEAAGGPVLTPIQLDAALVLTSAIQKMVVPGDKAASLVLTPQVSRMVFEQIDASLSVSPSMFRTRFLTLAGGVTLSPAFVLRLTRLRTLAATLTLTPALTRLPVKTLAVTLTNTSAISRLLFRTLAASLVVTPAMVFVRFYRITLAAGLTLTSAISLRITRLVTLASSLTLMPSLVRTFIARRTLAASLTMTSSLTRLPLKTLAATETNTAAITLRRIRLQSLASTLTVAPVITFQKVHQTPITLSASLSMSGVFVKRVSRAVDASLTMTPTLNRRINLAVAASLVLGPALVKAKQWARALAATLTLAPTIALRKVKLQALSASLTVIPAFTLKVIARRTLSASLALTAALRLRVGRRLDASMTVNPSVNRNLSLRLTAAAVLNAGLVSAKLAKPRFLNAALSLIPGITLFEFHYRRFERMLVTVGLRKPDILSASMVEPEIESIGLSRPGTPRVGGDRAEIELVDEPDKPTIGKVL